MDVIFEPQRGRPFSIEVGFFDTVLEIKEKVQKYQGIPISQQTLIFNGQPLQDTSDIEKCEILHNSRIQLHVAAAAAAAATDAAKPPPPAAVKTEELSSPAAAPLTPTNKLQLNLKTPLSKMPMTLEMDSSDTILRLKEKIQEIEAIQNNNKLVLHVGGIELQDHQILRDCEISNNSEIDTSLSPLLPVVTTTSGGNNGNSSGGGGGGSSKKLKVMILTKCGTKKIPIEVNASDNVGELRKELQKLNQNLQFHLPPEGYFFIYKQNVMDDDRSFRWHQVSQGDTIEIFNGSVTGGGS